MITKEELEQLEEKLKGNRKTYKVFDKDTGVFLEAHKDWICNKEWRDNSETTGKILVTIRKYRDPVDMEEIVKHRIALTKESWSQLTEAIDKLFKEMSEDMV